MMRNRYIPPPHRIGAYLECFFVFYSQMTTHAEICLYLVNARPVLLVIFLVIYLERLLAPNAKEPPSLNPSGIFDRGQC